MSKILVIDDDRDFREMVTEMLETKGYQVRQEVNGADGIMAFENGKFDLVITDLVMPNEDGVGVIMKIKSLKHDQKIIAMSGGGNWGGVDYLAMTKDLGVNATFEKPFSSFKFIAQVKALLEA